MKELAIIGTSMIDQVFTAKEALKFNQCNKGSMSVSVGRQYVQHSKKLRTA